MWYLKACQKSLKTLYGLLKSGRLRQVLLYRDFPYPKFELVTDTRKIDKSGFIFLGCSLNNITKNHQDQTLYFPLFVRVLCSFSFCYALLCVHSSFAIILKRKKKAGCFSIFVLQMYCYYKCAVTLPLSAVE